ncbi:MULTISPECIES: hypothetical protein [Enterococcus]|uniref:hypothetical protein n=1 Tax=Enterococcus TaxID=1350 RepID=UPI0007C17517|nr:hypothetical protein [Enterococcus hirae]AND71462.1 hypothetical protein A6P53_00780 [Enterococcus hirae]
MPKNRLINYMTKNWKIAGWNIFDSLFLSAAVIVVSLNIVFVLFPDLDNYYTNALNLFLIGLMMVFVGLGESVKSKVGKRIDVLVGSVWVIYFCLYYFTGFHNPTWMNWHFF